MANKVLLERNILKISVEVKITETVSMLEFEEAVQEALNQVGTLATSEGLKRFDSDGSPILVGGVKLTSKGQVGKAYQTPYGQVIVERHVYQGVWGGKTYCPLDHQARVVNTSTPRFAKMAAFKYGVMKSTIAQKDLQENHGRRVSRCFLQDIAEDVAAIAQRKQERWRYEDRPLPGVVQTIGLGVDGTCMLFCKDGYRQAMVGTIALYDEMGQRLHTTYVAAAPQYGKEDFYVQMEREIAGYRKRYSWAKWVGVADGARDHWPWLKRHTDQQILDFYHTFGYLERAAPGLCKSKKERSQWITQNAHDLKHTAGAARSLLTQMDEALENAALTKKAREDLSGASKYFANNLTRMNYASYRKRHLPIGSGVTEAACKSLVKERMCGSGMKWKQGGASAVLRLRSLIQSTGRWDLFWAKVSKFGI